MKRFYSVALLLGVLLVPLWYYGRTKTDRDNRRFFWRELFFHETEKREQAFISAATAAQAEAEKVRIGEEEKARAAERAAEAERQWQELLTETVSGIAMFDGAAEESDRWYREIPPLYQSKEILELIRKNSVYVRAFERFYEAPLSRTDLSAKRKELQRIRQLAENGLRYGNGEGPGKDETYLVRSISADFANTRSGALQSRKSINTLVAVMENRVPETVEAARAMVHMRDLLFELRVTTKSNWDDFNAPGQGFSSPY